MNQDLKKEMLKTIDITRENITNSMQVMLESYSESLAKLDLLVYLINNEKN